MNGDKHIREARLRLERTLEEMNRVSTEWDKMMKLQREYNEKRLSFWREKNNR